MVGYFGNFLYLEWELLGISGMWWVSEMNFPAFLY
jgi:hypothetical protein